MLITSGSAISVNVCHLTVCYVLPYVKIAGKQEKTVKEVYSEVTAMLNDIGHTFTLKSIRLMAYLLRKVFRNIYSGIKVNMDGLNRVRPEYLFWDPRISILGSKLSQNNYSGIKGIPEYLFWDQS